MRERTANLVFLAVTILVTGVMGVIGVCVNALFSGIVAGIAISILLIMYIHPILNPAVPAGRRVLRIRNRAIRVAEIVLVLAAFPLLIGMYSPKINKSIDRRSENTKQAVANFIDKGSLKSEAESGVFGTLSADTGIYDGEGKQYISSGMEVVLRQGTVVKAADLDGKPANSIREGFTRIIAPNKRGDFACENVVFVPSAKIDWVRTISR